MSYILESLLNYSLLIFVYILIEIFLCLYYKKKNIQITVGFLFGYQLLICLMIAILTITGIPGVYKVISIDHIQSMNMVFYIENIFSFDCIMNIIMFIPLGVLVPMLWRNAHKWYCTFLCGFILSLCIELSQIFSFRASDINDILTNTLGMIIGYLIFNILLRKIHIIELDDRHLLLCQPLIQILIIFMSYFLIGEPLLSMYYGF